jgi:hypothetical protein
MHADVSLVLAAARQRQQQRNPQRRKISLSLHGLLLSNLLAQHRTRWPGVCATLLQGGEVDGAFSSRRTVAAGPCRISHLALIPMKNENGPTSFMMGIQKICGPVGNGLTRSWRPLFYFIMGEGGLLARDFPKFPPPCNA